MLCCVACLAPKNTSVAMFLSTHFRNLFIQDCVALLQGFSGNNAANRFCRCYHFLSDFCLTRYLLRFLWHQFSIFKLVVPDRTARNVIVSIAVLRCIYVSNSTWRLGLASPQRLGWTQFNLISACVHAAVERKTWPALENTQPRSLSM